jgi:hypothetical protein
MREGTTSMVMAADRPNGEFYDFYSVSPEYFGNTLVFLCAAMETWLRRHLMKISESIHGHRTKKNTQTRTRQKK